jgi:hypothetical protein
LLKKGMKRIITLFMGCCILTCQARFKSPNPNRPTRPAPTRPAPAPTRPAQPVDTSSQLAASYFKEAAAAGRNQHIWNAAIYGHMLFVDPRSRVTYANMPDSAGIFKPDGGIYKGVLPKEVILANTAIDWQGQEWSVILWPLPANRDDRVNLMMHESFHRIQEQLGLPERSPTADHLSGMYGRIYYLLELQALKAALQKQVDQRGGRFDQCADFPREKTGAFP